MVDDTERQEERKKNGEKLPVLHSFSPREFLITGFHASLSEVSGLLNLKSVEPAALNQS